MNFIGHFLAAKVQGIEIESYNVGYGPKIVSFNDTSNVEYNFRLLPLGGYVAFPTNVIIDENGDATDLEDENPNLLQNRAPWQRAIVISGGVAANVLLTFLISCYVATSTGLVHPTYDNGIIVNSRVTNAPGMMAGVQINDVITKINNYEIMCTSNSNCVPDFVKKVQNTPEGQFVNLEIQRPTSTTGKNEKNLNLPTKTNKKLLKIVIDPNRNPTSGRATIGLGVAPNILAAEIIKAKNPVEAITIGSQETYNQFKTISNGLIAAASTGFQGAEIGGPISVIKAGATVVQYDATAILGFASFLSINLAILNSLPLPALDGGQLLFVLIEWLNNGRKIPRDIQTGLIGLAFSFLLVVSSATLVNDLSHINDPTPMTPTPNRIAK